jgi:hypothetical protein
MNRWQRSFALVKASWSVIRSEPGLVLLPVMSFLATLAVAATFLIPVVATTDLGSTHTSLSVTGWVLVFAMYLVLSYVSVFFNVALICAAQERFDGGDPTLGSALAGAARNAGRILPWAVVSATVSMVLKAIQNRAGIVGTIVAGIAGVAWALVTFMVLPIIVIEHLGVGAAIKRSASLFKQVWGEQVVANVGIGLFGFLAVLCGTPVLILLATGNATLMVVGAGVFVVWFLLVVGVTNAMNGVFQTALYRYAATGQAPQDFAGVDLAHAFVPRHHRGG